MRFARSPRIKEVDFGDGDFALVTKLSTKPFGRTAFISEDTSDDSRGILQDLISWWDHLWPDMLEKLQDGIEGYETGQTLGADDFIGSASRMDPECYMGDKSDIFLRIEFQEPPLWDYFLRDGKIAHFQPVF